MKGFASSFGSLSAIVTGTGLALNRPAGYPRLSNYALPSKKPDDYVAKMVSFASLSDGFGMNPKRETVSLKRFVVFIELAL